MQALNLNKNTQVAFFALDHYAHKDAYYNKILTVELRATKTMRNWFLKPIGTVAIQDGFTHCERPRAYQPNRRSK